MNRGWADAWDTVADWTPRADNYTVMSPDLVREGHHFFAQFEGHVADGRALRVQVRALEDAPRFNVRIYIGSERKHRRNPEGDSYALHIMANVWELAHAERILEGL